MRRRFLVTVALCAAAAFASAQPLTAKAQGAAPRYEVDASWPKPLPDRWVLGGLGGVCVDAQDHVLILNRQDILEGELNCGHLAPPIIEFDPGGQRGQFLGRPQACSTRACTAAISTRTTMFGSPARHPA